MRFFFRLSQLAGIVVVFSAGAALATELIIPQGRVSSSATLPQRCGDHLLKAHTGAASNSAEEGLKVELADFRTVAEQALALRAETITVGKRIKNQMEQGKPLSGDDLALLNIGITEHLKLRKELLEIAEAHECWLDGSEQELRQLGIWNHPLVGRYHEQIRQGRGVVEALRSGVEMNPLEQFMNIDSVGVLRKPSVNAADRSNIILQALRQVGKPYDFNFDVESKGKVYCSKLVYLTYSGIEWPTKRSLGRTTFTPDDVAAKALSGDFQLILFYHDGKQVDAPLLQRMAELMRAPQQLAADRQASVGRMVAH